jgi:hypothetical protein
MEEFPKEPSNNEEADPAILEKIAEEILSEKGQSKVSELLRGGEIEKAKAYLLGGVDGCFERGTITFETAAAFYKQIGVSPECASKLRQGHSEPPQIAGVKRSPFDA